MEVTLFPQRMKQILVHFITIKFELITNPYYVLSTIPFALNTIVNNSSVSVSKNATSVLFQLYSFILT